MTKKDKLSTQPYKGVRDFFPADSQTLNYLFKVMRETVERYGYLEYQASILEPIELYTQKNSQSQEIVNEQMYHFTDRGGRQVALRPEMTPTTARMISAKLRDLTMPTRWYSIPNVFRYENPQKGRLREHYQLNVDLFGGNVAAADEEMLTLAHNIMTNFGAQTTDFIIKINNRRMINALFDKLSIPADSRQPLSRSLDKKEKLNRSEFSEALKEILGPATGEQLQEIMDRPEYVFEILTEEIELITEITSLLDKLSRLNISNVIFDPGLIRGFDYYTGLLFEIKDTDPTNPRSIAGGGRYDALTGLFTKEEVPAVGFGMGDVSLLEFLNSRHLLPEPTSPVDLSIIPLNSELIHSASVIASKLRETGLNIDLDSSDKKHLKDKLKRSVKMEIPFVLFVGPEELEKEIFPLKDLRTEIEVKLPLEKITPHITKTNKNA